MFKVKLSVLVTYLVVYTALCDVTQAKSSREDDSGGFTLFSVIVGGIAGVAAAPFVLPAVGFTAAGITAGSIGASMMSSLGGAMTASGSVVAIAQSAGATGTVLGSAAATATAATIGAGVAYAAVSAGDD